MSRYRFTEPNTWVRHIARKFDIAIPYEAQRRFRQVGRDVTVEISRLFSGHPGQPQDAARPGWLAKNDHPFARRHGVPTAESLPIGTVSFALAASLRIDTQRSNGLYTISYGSEGVAYAKFILSDDGTLTMLPRGMKQAVATFAERQLHEFTRGLRLWIRRY
jgi:hypothetical protein